MLRKTLPNFWIFVFTSILFVIQFCIIECSYDVLDLSIFVIYDVQYVTIAYGFKTTRVLNALIFMFLSIFFS
jgi:hypothetical protein